MNRVVLILGAFALALGLLLLGPVSVYADTPAQTIASDLSVAIEVQDNGEWIAHIGGDGGLALASTDVASIASLMGYDIPLALDASMLQMAKDYGVGSIGLVKEGAKSTIVINGVPATAVTISDAAVTELMNAFMPELDSIAATLNQANVTVVAYMPWLGGDARLASLDTSAAVATEPVNIIDLGATLSPKGEILSVGGMTMESLGFSGNYVDLSWLEGFGIEDASIALNAWGASVSSGGQEWISVAWDTDLAIKSVPELAGYAGFPLASEDMQMVQLAADWLKGTQINVGAYIADAPMEKDAMVQIGRPLHLGVQGGALMVEGVNTGFLLDADSLEIAKEVGAASVVWDGTANQLRLSVDNKPMPALMMDEGFLDEVGTATMGNWLPWAAFERLMANTHFAADFSYEDHAATEVAVMDYKVAAPAPAAPLALDLKVSRADGRIEAFGEALPLDLIDGSISANVLWALEQAGPGIESVNVNLGPGGLTVGLNGKNAYLAWDGTLRDNLVATGLSISGQQFGLPALATSGIVADGIKFLIGLANQVDVGINVSFTDQPIPPGSIESLARSVAYFTF